MQKRGQWNVADAIDLDKASELIDTKMGNAFADDLRRELGVDALKPNKPLLVPNSKPGLGKIDPNSRLLNSGANSNRSPPRVPTFGQ